MFSKYLDSSKRIQANHIAANSRKVYDSYLKKYEIIMSSMEGAPEPYPMTTDSIRGCIMYMKEELNYTYSTLRNCIAAFSFHLKSNDLPDVTKEVSFKLFKTGLNRTMNGSAPINRKEPICPFHFKQMLDSVQPVLNSTQSIYFLMSLMYFGFLRISEALHLLNKDLEIENDNLTIHIRRSKTDQTGSGHVVKIVDNNQSYSPFRFIQVLDGLKEDDKVFPLSLANYHNRIKRIFVESGMDSTKFSSHSFRRGGAYNASINGIEDAVIKAHGRWKSDAYVLYVRVDSDRAGLEISKAL
jgi:hypothetical protein